MKKLLTILLSVFMTFSSCLMISAEESYIEVNDNLSFYAGQNDNGDLIFKAKGEEAENFINELVKVDSEYDIKIWSHSDDYWYSGALKNNENETSLEIIDKTSLKVSKENLKKYGYVNGKLYIFIYDITEYSIEDFNIGVDAIDNRTKKIDIQVNTDLPAVGKTTKIDQSKITVTDENGNKLSSGNNYGKAGYYAFWTENYYPDEQQSPMLRATAGLPYFETEDETFQAGKEYYLVVSYVYNYTHYCTDPTHYCNDPIEVTSNIDFTYQATGHGHLSNEIEPDNYFNTTRQVCFSSKKGYVAKAEEPELAISAAQNDNGDLVINIQGTDAKNFIEEVTDTEGYKYISLTIGNYYGTLRGNSVKVGDGFVTISKEDLNKGGFISGDYTLKCISTSGRIFESSVSLTLDNTVTPTQLETLKFNDVIKTPIVGDTVSYDDTDVNIVDENGKQVARVSYRWTKKDQYCSVLNEDGSCKTYSYNYVPGEEHEFKEGETYYYTVDYYYTKPMQDNITTVLKSDNYNFENIGTSAGKGASGIPSCALDTLGFQSFVVAFTPKAASVEVKPTESKGVSEEIASKVTINNNAGNVQSLINITTDEQKAIDEGKKLEVKMVVSSQSEVAKEEVTKVETKASATGLTTGVIYDISIYKNIEGKTNKTKITETSDKLEISFPLEEKLVNNDSSINREYKVVRIHEGEDVEVLDATYDETTKSITFKTDKFSTYAICYKDTKKNETNTSSNNNKVVTCEEYMNSKDWTWSESKKACVYRVTNTSAK